MPLSSKSSLTLSIHLFLCIPVLLYPLICTCSAAFGSLFPSILSTCPNHSSPLLFDLLYHRFHCSKFFSCFLIFNSFSSASDHSQLRHFCHQKSSLVFFPQCTAPRMGVKRGGGGAAPPQFLGGGVVGGSQGGRGGRLRVVKYYCILS